MRATRILMEEHRYILRSLEVISEMADRAANGEDVDARDVDCILQFPSRPLETTITRRRKKPFFLSCATEGQQRRRT